MAIVRWDPFREIETLQREMNRLFDAVGPGTTPAVRGNGGMMTFVPPAEISETEDAVNLRLEVPGMEAKDLDVQVAADSVAISGERRSETKSEEGGAVRSEFRYGRFERVIPLPTQIQNDKVEAHYKDGILNLKLPKLEEEKRKVVKVTLN